MTFSVAGGAGANLLDVIGSKLVYVGSAGDFEISSQRSFEVIVNATDGAGNTKEQTVAVNLTNLNEKPPEIILPNTEVLESAIAGKFIGALDATDPDSTSGFTYLLANGDTGGRFSLLTGNGVTKLVVKEGSEFDYEQTTSHTLTIMVTDDGSISFDRSLVIDVGDIHTETHKGTARSGLLKGGAGRDVLYGGLGNDTLTGSSGQDAFVSDTKPSKVKNFDRITDFSVTDDSIWLDNAVFTKLGSKCSLSKPAQLKKDCFVKGSVAKDDYLICDSKGGKLFYDVDALGRRKQAEFVVLPKNLKTIAYSDIFVI